jgi:hypothetical protein
MQRPRIALAAIMTLALSATPPARAGEAAKANLDILRDTIGANQKATSPPRFRLSRSERSGGDR